MTYLIGKHPYLTLKVKLSPTKWQSISCLIDTGFSGGLTLPQKFRSYFPEAQFVQARYLLANGTEVTVDATYTTVVFNHLRKEVTVIFMGNSDSLAGIEFLDQMRFCLDLKQYQVELT